MFFRTALLTSLAQRRTSQPSAWKDGYYETYRLTAELPAVRVHGRSKAPGGRWFAVDTYNVSVAEFQEAMALIASDRPGRAWKFKNPDIAWYCLRPGTVVNVGLVAEQGYHKGGGVQFEFVDGEDAYLLGQASERRQVRL
jgi:hypothetical protein